MANNKSSSFDRNYEGQTLFCYMISYFIVFIHCQVSEFGLAAREYEIKASYHNKLPLVGFAEKKKYFLSWLDYVSDIPF